MSAFSRFIALAVVVSLQVTPIHVVAQENAYPLQMSGTRVSHRPEVPGPNGLVTAGHPLASMAGLRILMAGGNAADASVAVLATLNVVRPQMSGAGGNGFFTYYDKISNKLYALSATGAAPFALDPGMLDSEELNKGIKAGVVPGLFGGWIALLQKFGTLSLAEVLAPAIGYARDGHPIEASVVRSIESSETLFREFPSSSEMFLPEGQLPQSGEKVVYSDLARTFERLVAAEQKALAAGANRSEALQAAFVLFYRGAIAKEMADFYGDNAGLFTLEDFAAYEPLWSAPIHASYRGYDIYTSPPTSRGGLEVLMQLKLVEGFDLPSMGWTDPLSQHVMIEAVKVAKADIYKYVADPRLYEVPVAGMLESDYLGERRALISKTRAMGFPGPGVPQGDAGAKAVALSSFTGLSSQEEASVPGSTTSFSIRDKNGNVMAATPTHGGAFGTGVVVGGTGLTFNNGTRVGSTSPYPDHANYARGGQVPILNNSPIIVMKDGEFVMALGTPGGETIGQTQFQVLVNVLDFGMPVQAAIEAPRFSVFAEPNFYKEGSQITLRFEDRLTQQQFDDLKDLGHDLRLAPSFSLGSIQAILKNDMGTVTAGADPRRAAQAVGW
ncbi:gamma-glutamyltransferase family protein [Congregibacter brevis]|uniref:Gamma-glutamyltransferase family protein n=1 Tax=Congregibacter brevis TaxID=3081201 RepID=A0ABZ0I9V4_9GAMM|nr:gamma-glutamyltransferase family protein [Congregibacter sp. IMCC45268]